MIYTTKIRCWYAKSKRNKKPTEIIFNLADNLLRRGVKPKFSELQVVALALTAEALAIENENLRFHKLKSDYENEFQNLISHRQFNDRRKKLQSLLNQKEFRSFARSRKRIETTFSQLCDQFMLTRNYAKNFDGFSTRILSEISAFTLLQLLNHAKNRPLSLTKYALI